MLHRDILVVHHPIWLAALDFDDLRDGKFYNFHQPEPHGIFIVSGEEGSHCVWDSGGSSNIFVFDV